MLVFEPLILCINSLFLCTLSPIARSLHGRPSHGTRPSSPLLLGFYCVTAVRHPVRGCLMPHLWTPLSFLFPLLAFPSPAKRVLAPVHRSRVMRDLATVNLSVPCDTLNHQVVPPPLQPMLPAEGRRVAWCTDGWEESVMGASCMEYFDVV